MKVGIIGLPQTGKTSLYNALTRSQVDLNRFGAAEVNVGVIPVPDPAFRLRGGAVSAARKSRPP